VTYYTTNSIHQVSSFSCEEIFFGLSNSALSVRCRDVTVPSTKTTTVKYVIMFTFDPELDAKVPPERMQALYGRAYEWYGEHAAQIADGGAQLQPVETATTVKYSEAGTVVVDGPFSEAKEVVGGFSVIDVPDMDAAIALARTWPYLELPGWGVEIRPIVDHG